MEEQVNLALRLAAALFGCAYACIGAAQQPHIVYILADDLGWKDVGYTAALSGRPTSTSWHKAAHASRSFIRSPTRPRLARH